MKIECVYEKGGENKGVQNARKRDTNPAANERVNKKVGDANATVVRGRALFISAKKTK